MGYLKGTFRFSIFFVLTGCNVTAPGGILSSFSPSALFGSFATPTPEPRLQPSPTPTGGATPTPTSAPGHTPTPTITPTPTPTATPISTPTPTPVPMSGTTPALITITPDMIINESTQGDATQLFDEQNAANPTTIWSPGWDSTYLPASVVIDFGVQYKITGINFYDSSGSGTLTFQNGSVGNWQTIFTDPQTGYNVWSNHTVNVTTRYLRMALQSNLAPSELKIYGYPLFVYTPPTLAAHTPPLMQDFIGVNAFIDDPIGRTEAFGTVREYHEWSWTEGDTPYPSNQCAFNSSYGGGWDFDSFYQTLAQEGMSVFPALQQSVSWLSDGDADSKPVVTGHSTQDPQSYVAHADHLFQYAARYGASTIASNRLKLASGQPVISGQNIIHYFEDWNEQDKNWRGALAYFNPYDYSAMASADYDGHLGTLGANFGVKAADSNARLVMGGLASDSLDYIKSMKLWADANRAGSFPADVINIHHYSINNTSGISPEADHVKEMAQSFSDYRSKFLPGKELWVSEFGYDTNPTSSFRAPAIGNASQQEVQGEWLIRSYLALVAGGVDRAQAYMLRDVDASDPTQFSSSGMTSSQSTGWVPKISWYYIYTMKNRLTNMRFDQVISSGNSAVSVYRFKTDDGVNAAYAVWANTSNGTTISSYSLPLLRSSETAAKLVTLTNGQKNGVESALTVSNTHVTLNVSERPVFVMTTTSGTYLSQPADDYQLMLSPTMVTNESGQGNATYLVDEQSSVGDVKNGAGGSPTTVWQPGANSPVSAYLDLGQNYHLSKIYLRDVNGVGNATISTGTPGSWTPLFTDGLGGYMTWNEHPANNITTRYIRVTLGSANANLSEIVVYVKP